MTKKAIIVTFDGDAHFIAGKEPSEFIQAIERSKFMALPNGSYINTSSVKGVYTYEDYVASHEIADHHKRHEWLSADGHWRTARGELLGRADMKMLINKIDHVSETKQATIGGGAAGIERGASGLQNQ